MSEEGGKEGGRKRKRARDAHASTHALNEHVRTRVEGCVRRETFVKCKGSQRYFSRKISAKVTVTVCFQHKGEVI